MHKYELSAFFVYNGFVVEKQLTKEHSAYFHQTLLDNFVLNKYKTLWEFGFVQRSADYSPSLAFLHNIARTFIEQLAAEPSMEVSRSAPSLPSNYKHKILDTLPFVIGSEFINIYWLRHIWRELGSVFEADALNHTGTVGDYLRSKTETLHPMGRVYFNLAETAFPEFPFALLATYSSGNKENIVQRPLNTALSEYQDQAEPLLHILSIIDQVAQHSSFIFELLDSSELFAPIKLTAAEAYTFLTEMPIYEQYGVICRAPQWWYSRPQVRLTLSIVGSDILYFQPDTELQLCAQIYIGELPYSYGSAKALLHSEHELTLLDGVWTDVNHKRLKLVLSAFTQVSGISALSIYEALRLQLGLNKFLPSNLLRVVELEDIQWLENLQSNNLAHYRLQDIQPTAQFQGSLRPYQHAGFNWLYWMYQLGLGALLADDMGLGKTIQTIAFLDHLRVHQPGKTLLVVPASLLANWQQELEHFAPHLRYLILNKQRKGSVIGLDKYFDNYELFITTYTMLPNIINEINTYSWDIVIIDEAQNIKNHQSRQSKLTKTINSKFRIALTGTPIENKLSDLWSLFEFLNAGFLGSIQHFNALGKTLLNKFGTYSTLRLIVNPFILRRSKSDKNIISDLPDKIELVAFTELSTSQIALYKQLSAHITAAITAGNLVKDTGLLLSTIMQFKQICNHPDLYFHNGDFDPKHSNKFARLRELCEVIAEKREKVLVFTQFQEMCQPLTNFLNQVFERPGLTIHGQIPMHKRTEIIDKFNTDDYIPFIVLSLKTGGVGLNLTAANHVIHFDRWWNPAVENQATDRAYRIGQQKNVLVHKLITKGTVEEKIDEIIASKEKMFGQILPDNETSFLNDLDHNALLNLFQLEV